MTDFGMLLHAYGPATDTPGHLAALLDGDEEARRAAQQHLWGAIIHQGTPWTATPPAAVAVAGLLGDPRLADPALRADLLRFLAAVAEAGQPGMDLSDLAPPDGFDVDAAVRAAIEADDDEAIYGDEVLGNAVYGRAIAGCREVTPAILAAARAALSDADATVRAAAAGAISACRGVSAADDLAARAAAATGADERAALVLAMGELGHDTRDFLADPHPGVRACAALAQALADDESATEELLAALRDPAATDGWFASKPPQFPLCVRFPLIAAAVARVADPERLLPAALALAPIASIHTARSDWGVLLRALPPAERAVYLRALAANADLWDPRNGTVGLIFRDLGLEYDRAAHSD